MIHSNYANVFQGVVKVILMLICFIGAIGGLFFIFGARWLGVVITLSLFNPSSVVYETTFGEIFISSTLTAIGFLLWYLCKRFVQEWKIYLWIALVITALIIFFDFFAIYAEALSLSDLLASQGSGVSSPILSGLFSLGHAIFVAFIARYHWRLIREPNQNQQKQPPDVLT